MSRISRQSLLTLILVTIAVALTIAILMVYYYSKSISHKLNPDQLYKAMEAGDTRAILKALRADPNLLSIRDDDGFHLLHTAILTGNLSVCESLLNAGANVDSTDNSGATALAWAAWAGDKGIVELLMAHNADGNLEDYYGRTPLMRAIEGNKVDVVKILVGHASTYMNVDVFGNTPLSYAVQSEDPTILKVILEKTRNLDEVDARECLARAARDCLSDIMKILLSHKGLQMADIIKYSNPSSNEVVESPVILAARSGCPDCVQQLLDAGFDSQTRDRFENTAMSCSLDTQFVEPDTMEASDDDVITVLQLLLSHNADIDATNRNGEAPLHRAILTGNTKIVRFLLEMGADVNLETNDGETPTKYAEAFGNEELIRVLQEFGGDF